MDRCDSSFAWARELNCPKNIITNRIENALCKENVGYLWYQMSTLIHSTKETSETKKNILLHELQTNKFTPIIENINKLQQIKTERLNLAKQIATLERDVAEKEFTNRQAVQKHRQKVETVNNLKIKNNILKFKFMNNQSDIEDLTKMQEICRNLAPPSNDNIEPWMLEKCLSLISTLASGADKKEIWEEVNKIIGSIRISTLWNLLLQSRITTNNELSNLLSDKTNDINQNIMHNVEYGFAKLSTKYIETKCNSLVHKMSCIKHEDKIVQQIEKIDTEYDNKCPEFSDWLVLLLEVNKLEVYQINLQNELSSLQKYTTKMIEDQNNQNYAELNDIYDSLKYQEKVAREDIRKSYNILKCATTFIIEARDLLLTAMQDLQSIVIDYKTINLQDELTMFYTNFNINANRCISLKGNVNAYRHLSTCINEALTSLIVPVNHNKYSSFPMIKAPYFYLMDCLKAFVTKERLQEEINLFAEQGEKSDFWQINCRDIFSNSTNSESTQLMNILATIDATRDEAMENIQTNYNIINEWSSQSVEKALLTIFDDIKVDGATLKEWQSRFSMLLYMIQQN